MSYRLERPDSEIIPLLVYNYEFLSLSIHLIGGSVIVVEDIEVDTWVLLNQGVTDNEIYNIIALSNDARLAREEPEDLPEKWEDLLLMLPS